MKSHISLSSLDITYCTCTAECDGCGSMSEHMREYEERTIAFDKNEIGLTQHQAARSNHVLFTTSCVEFDSCYYN